MQCRMHRGHLRSGGVKNNNQSASPHEIPERKLYELIATAELIRAQSGSVFPGPREAIETLVDGSRHTFEFLNHAGSLHPIKYQQLQC